MFSLIKPVFNINNPGGWGGRKYLENLQYCRPMQTILFTFPFCKTMFSLIKPVFKDNCPDIPPQGCGATESRPMQTILSSLSPNSCGGSMTAHQTYYCETAVSGSNPTLIEVNHTEDRQGLYCTLHRTVKKYQKNISPEFTCEKFTLCTQYTECTDNR